VAEIPGVVREQIQQRVERFNREVIQDVDLGYVPRFRGSFIYLDRKEWGGLSRIGRLTYDGDVDDCEFAIFKYSSERYDPDEWMFPGFEELDGTVEGAMRAGLMAYPNSALDALELEALSVLPAAGPAPRTAGRNDPCPCGSGKKYKRCCWRKRRPL
jgi:hypothetical protein